jgi:hypothetical protein
MLPPATRCVPDVSTGDTVRLRCCHQSRDAPSTLRLEVLGEPGVIEAPERSRPLAPYRLGAGVGLMTKRGKPHSTTDVSVTRRP